MTTAQVLFAQYQVLPSRIRQQFKKLIVAADKPVKISQVIDDDEDDSGDTIRISLEALHTSIEQVKLLRAGKADIISMEELFASLNEDEAND